MTQKTMRIWIWAVVAVLGIGLAGGTFLLRQQQPQASSFGQASFNLVDQNGTPVDQSILKGQPSVLFFGFTHCPEVCPTTLAEMSTWFEQLGEEGKDLRGFFASVDPERDTPEILGDYIGWVPQVTGLTGSPEEMAKLAKAWGVYYAQQPLDGGDYTMDHTASVFLLDKNGEFQGTIAYGEDSATAVGKIRNLLTKS
jgi:protein SCO1/2